MKIFNLSNQTISASNSLPTNVSSKTDRHLNTGMNYIMENKYYGNTCYKIGLRFLFLLVTLPLFSCLSDWGIWGKGDVNLSKATWLVAKQVPLITDKGGIPGGGVPVVPVNNLFTLPPGTKVKAAALGGAIDPTGTTIINDFDGDGILNSNETTTNVWIADYPQIESVIAPPITMKVAIEQEVTHNTELIDSEINSDDFESGKSEGTDKIHQSELNLKTVQFQDQYSSSSKLGASLGGSIEFGASVDTAAVSAGVNYGASFNNSWEASNSLSTTTTKWADRPFKNNLDSDSLNLKSNSSSQKARNYRSEKSVKSQDSFHTSSLGGYVRAALYIKNDSVNMPVKVSHILCSLMFETPKGELIPVHSFELTNADGSNFEIEVYGGTEFGPYVIELTNLNSNEVERAVASGYNPKIFIVDYEMTHVKDSNYRSSLLNFSGENLKIIEENAKGRTSLVKIFGPNKREIYRVAAFDVVGANNSDICKASSADSLAPGISLEKALKKLSCSGKEIEFENYVIDFAEVAPTLGESKLHIRGIKSFDGIRTTIPCDPTEKVGSDGVTRTACVQKPISQWSETQLETAGVWTVYSKGKYYSPTTYYLDNENSSNPTKRLFDTGATLPAYMVKSLESTVWPGDTYDIVFVSAKDLIKKQKQFGTNPLETGKEFTLNTTWDLTSLGAHPYYADKNSMFLGDAGFGEQVRLQVKIDKTNYLNPNFGIPQSAGLSQFYSNFTYNNQKSENKFEINQVWDFEVSLGFGGTRTDWIHIHRDVVDSSDTSAGSEFKIKNCGRSANFEDQTFTLCFQLPQKHPYVDAQNSLIKLYIRPSLNSAYRRTAWPLRYSEVRKVQANLYTPALKTDTSILLSASSIINSGSSSFQTGDVLRIAGDSNTYTISNTPVQQLCEPNTANLAQCLKINLNSAILNESARTTSVYVLAGLTAPNMRLSVENTFATAWNVQYLTPPVAGLWETPQFLPLVDTPVNCSSNLYHPSCLGFNTDSTVLNWLGGYNTGVAHWNSWSDGGNLLNYLTNGLTTLVTNTGKIFRLENIYQDFDFSPNTSLVNIPTEVTNVSNGNGQILSVWKVGTDLFGKAYDPKLGASSNVIQLNSTPLTGKYVVKGTPVSSGGILLIYETGNIVTGGSILFTDVSFYVDQSVGNLNPVQIWVGSSGTVVSGRIYAPGAATSSIDFASAYGDERYFAFWNSAPAGTTVAQTGNYRVLQRSSGIISVSTPSNAAFYVSPAATSNRLQIAASGGNMGLVAYIYSVGTTSYTIYSNGIDSAGGGVFADTKKLIVETVTGTGLVAPTPNMSDFTYSNTGTGLVSWIDSAGIAYGRVRTINSQDISGTGGVLLGTAKFTIDQESPAVAVSNLKITLAESYALATYNKGTHVYVRPISLIDGTPATTSALQMDVSSATSKKAGGTVYANLNGVQKFFTFWEHSEGSPVKKSIRGRFGNLQDLTKPEGTAELFVSTTNSYDQSSPTGGIGIWSNSGIYEGSAFVAWLSADPAKPIIRGASVNLKNAYSLPYGVNNFFVAPLIERDYTIKANITY